MKQFLAKMNKIFNYSPKSYIFFVDSQKYSLDFELLNFNVMAVSKFFILLFVSDLDTLEVNTAHNISEVAFFQIWPENTSVVNKVN